MEQIRSAVGITDYLRLLKEKGQEFIIRDVNSSKESRVLTLITDSGRKPIRIKKDD